MNDRPTVTVEIIDDDWRTADELQDRIDEDPARRGKRIAEALAAARQAGYEAGLAEGQDAAHASGHSEGYAAGRRYTRTAVAGRLDELLPAFGIRAGREVRAIVAELRLESRADEL